MSAKKKAWLSLRDTSPWRATNGKKLVMQIKKTKHTTRQFEFVFDVIALTETWINEDNANIFTQYGYKNFHRSRINKTVEELHCTLMIEFNIK